MDFELDDDQHALQEAVRDLVDNECPPELVRAVVEGRPSEAWRATAVHMVFGTFTSSTARKPREF